MYNIAEYIDIVCNQHWLTVLVCTSLVADCVGYKRVYHVQRKEVM